MNLSKRDKIEQNLKQYWGYTSLREAQWPIIDAITDKKDTLAILATGGGKSLCYQLPALHLDGLCLVISPLIALMEDQVNQLKKRNIAAESVHSGMNHKSQDRTLEMAMQGHIKLLYLSPERITSPMFAARVGRMNVSMIAVDEAHCISQWGHDFRPSYRKITQLSKQLKVPTIAVTATATPKVQKDIIQNLQLKDVQQFVHSARRSNLAYEVFKTEDKLGFILSFAKANKHETGLIYVRSRRLTKEISQLLNNNGLVSKAFHGGLKIEEKEAIQNSWIDDEVPLIVATNAFGMGIDKPDVRYVIHYEITPSLEEYIQEAGRAGRDGKPSRVIILYKDYDQQKKKKELSQSFPTKEYISKVYQALCSHYHIPPGEGVGQRYRFDLGEFCLKYSLMSLQAFYALKIIQAANYIYLSDAIYQPSRMRIHQQRYKAWLRSDKVDPNLQAYLRGVLRIYEGLFLEFVKINEMLIETKLDLKRKDHLPIIKKLQALYLLEYIPSHQKPYVSFLLKRPDRDRLFIPKEVYEVKLKKGTESLQAMFDYVDFENCRQIYIDQYFGDTNSLSCGICDNCEPHLNTAKKSEIKDRLMRSLSEGNTSFSLLKMSFSKAEWAFCKRILQEMEDEKQIDIIAQKIILNA